MPSTYVARAPGTSKSVNAPLAPSRAKPWTRPSAPAYAPVASPRSVIDVSVVTVVAAGWSIVWKL